MPIFQSGLINKFIFIPGFESSYGAQWEEQQAKRLGIDRLYLDEEDLEKGDLSFRENVADFDDLYGPAHFPWKDVDRAGLEHLSAVDIFLINDLVIEFCFFDYVRRSYWTHTGHEIKYSQIKGVRKHRSGMVAKEL